MVGVVGYPIKAGQSQF